MSEDQLNHLSSLTKGPNETSHCSSLKSNSFIMDFITDFHEDQLNDFKSTSSLQFSKSSISQIADPNTVIINKTNQNYQFADDVSMKTISDLSFNEIEGNGEVPNQAWRMSEAVTSAKNSFVDDFQDKFNKGSIHQSSFAVPNKMYCPQCDCEVATVVGFQVVEPDLLSRLEMFCKSLRCCVSQSLKIQHELIHMCRVCRKVLVRISAE